MEPAGRPGSVVICGQGDYFFIYTVVLGVLAIYYILHLVEQHVSIVFSTVQCGKIYTYTCGGHKMIITCTLLPDMYSFPFKDYKGALYQISACEK